MPKRTELSFETQHRIHRHERAREIAARDPELEPWQVAERFGIDESTAQKIVHRAREKAKRRSDDPVRVGARFGKLVVLLVDVAGKYALDGASCLCRCDCGREATVRRRFLKTQRSCSLSCASKASWLLRRSPERRREATA